jgi:hypothetical protein
LRLQRLIRGAYPHKSGRPAVWQFSFAGARCAVKQVAHTSITGLPWTSSSSEQKGGQVIYMLPDLRRWLSG